MTKWSCVALLLSGFSAACGGSSSETPPPLEPSPARLAEPPSEPAEPAPLEGPAVIEPLAEPSGPIEPSSDAGAAGDVF